MEDEVKMSEVVVSRDTITQVTATITNIIRSEKGDFVVTKSDEFTEGSITFSLDSRVWCEDMNPERGDMVVLEDLIAKRTGQFKYSWRAYTAHFLRPEIQHQREEEEEEELILTD